LLRSFRASPFALASPPRIAVAAAAFTRGGSKTRPRRPQQDRPKHLLGQIRARFSGGSELQLRHKKPPHAALPRTERSEVPVSARRDFDHAAQPFFDRGTSPCTSLSHELATWPLDKLLSSICVMKTDKKFENSINGYSPIPRYSHQQRFALSLSCPHVTSSTNQPTRAHHSVVLRNEASLITYHHVLIGNSAIRNRANRPELSNMQISNRQSNGV
jgi:hypothetical protein